VSALSRILLVLAACVTATAADAPKPTRPQSVVYLGKPDSDRGRQFITFLKAHFAHVEAADRDRHDSATVDAADVVLLDWPQAEAHPDGCFEFPYPERDLKSPLGSRDAWTKPTVLLGSAGHLLAACWQVHGGSG
jgi:hypothetical protein